MGAASKRLKRDDIESESGHEDESDMGLASKRWKEDDGDDVDEVDDDENRIGSNEESDQEIEMDEEGIEGSDGEQIKNEKDVEMEELEKEYHSLRNKEQVLLKNLKHQKDEDALKGQAVKNQKALWEKTLEFRFLLQKAFSGSNKLPQEPVRSSFCNLDPVVGQAYSDLILSSMQTLDSMLKLQEALLEKNAMIVQGANGNSKGSSKNDEFSNDLEGENDEEWLKIHTTHYRIAPFRNASVDKWQRKTQVTTGASAFKGKLQAFNQNISEQVAGHLRDPSRMIKTMQLRKSSVGVFGKVPEEAESTNNENGNAEGDPELLDDSEFYQQLLKKFFESCDLASSGIAFYALKKLQPKKRKVVDRRASKSRKIRRSIAFLLS